MALEKIGPYDFKGILGRGGMGTVYRGRHRESGEIHAVKVLAPTYAHDDHFRGRFESEIKSLLKLDHPNIVQMLSYGQEDAMLFFAMELVEGNSLFQMQRNGHQFDWREVLKISKEVCLGLRHAHDRGIIHRDLKPGNLLMTVDDNSNPDYVKITDFGIAKQFGSSQNTGENVLGTMDFMSPEQAKGELVTARSDLYSLGTVMFTLLSGRPPFTANSVEESLRNLTRVPAPHINTVVPSVPNEMDEMIKRMMAKRPENRIQTAQSLLHQIEEVETTLREYSEARTAHRLPPRPTDDTFDVGPPNTTENTDVPVPSKSTNSHSQTVEFTDHSEEYLPQLSTHEDYFETVTEETRQKVVEAVPPTHNTKGALPIALALIVVIVLASYGVFRAFQPPSAEELFSTIELGADRPYQVLNEIEEFLELYPDEARAQQVKQLQQIGESIEHYNTLSSTLSVRRSLNGESRLSEIEDQFMRIVDSAQIDPATASTNMKAFITFHNQADLNPRDQACLDAAKGYAVKIQHDAYIKIMDHIRQIRSALKRADETTNTDDAIQIYQSVLKLYGNTYWGTRPESQEGQELVNKTRDLLRVTQAAKRKSDQTKRQEDDPQPPSEND